MKKFSGKKLEKMRKKAKLEINDVIMGMMKHGYKNFSRTHYNSYKTELHEPGINTTIALAEILGCRIDDFITN